MVMIMVCICTSFKNILTIRKIRLYNKLTTNSVTYADYNRLLRNSLLRLSDGVSADCETVKWAFTHIFFMRRVKSPYFAVGPGYCPSSVQIPVSPLLSSPEVDAGDWMIFTSVIVLRESTLRCS